MIIFHESDCETNGIPKNGGTSEIVIESKSMILEDTEKNGMVSDIELVNCQEKKKKKIMDMVEFIQIHENIK